MPRAFIRLIVSALVLLTPISAAQGLSEVIQVPGDYASISAALAAAPDHSIIAIAAGSYREALTIERPVTLRAADSGEALLSANDAAVISIADTQDVTIEGLTVIGGEYGIFVTRSRDVVIADNLVAGSRLTGIKVRLGAAAIVDNTVIDARAPYGMGIHITNTTQWPASLVSRNIVIGNARSGIYTNMTGMITIEDNVVRDNGAHGIAVTEMSHADVWGNLVEENALSGIQLLDMSMATICDNIVSDTLGSSAAPQIRQGNGITVDFHSEAVVAGNTIAGSAQHGISVLYASKAWLHENAVENEVFVDESAVYDGSGCAHP